MNSIEYNTLNKWKLLIESLKTKNDGVVNEDEWVTLPVMPGIKFKGLRVSSDNSEDLGEDDKIQFIYDEWKSIDED